ncbi:hypothetical protein [Actinacidiphila rubida]|uniref:PD-(D/E)XK endonuclease-like domain-containing protein n=1 Tax=Actinacidiphila rubida TaxID=310780 RepID=A0A1H8SWJ2_9ACTN|nr:hypothetical protein [Actinacidiphila rubida]SEO82895.1 hypothetical protein SAMN05216267_104613 [Actinacidiphila rubida]
MTATTGRRTRAAAKPEPTGPDRIPQPSQGWYRIPGTDTKLRRVTTILSQGFPKPQLVFWAANLTAEDAFKQLPALVRASLRPETRADAYDWLRKGHIRKKDERADIGSAVHDVIEAKVLGTPVPDALLGDPEIAPFIDNFLRFVDEWQITFEASEMTVGNLTDGWAGKLDYLFRSPIIAHLLKVAADTLFIGDTKTGGELDEKGVYPEAGAQMSAYRRAEVCWLRDGSQVPMPKVHDTGIVLHLRPEDYRVKPLLCGDDVYAVFRHVQQVAEFQRVLSKSVVGEALTLPAVPEGRAA